MSASFTDTSSNDFSVTGKSQEHQQKLRTAKVADIEEENEKFNVVSSDVMNQNNSMRTESHQGVVQGDDQTVHTQQSNQLERTSATTATVCTPGGNEHIKLPETTQTSTSPQCDQNHLNTSIASKVTETRPQDNAESDFVSLRLGRYPGNSSGEEAGKNACNHKEHGTLHKELALGLEFRADTSYSELNSNLNSTSDLKRSEKGEDTGKEEKNRSLKTPRSGQDDNSENPPKKAKVVTVRMPCNTPVIGDGCQWKKYGQKAAEGSPFPKSYYRCHVTPTCEARKQVQICPNDLSTLITTYEGDHSHPLPALSTNVASDPTAAIPMSRCASTGSLTSHSSPQSLQAARSSQTTHTIQSSSQIFPSISVAQRSLISQPSGFPSSSLPPSGKSPALSITLPKTQYPLVQFGRFSPNFPGSPIFSPTSTTTSNFPASPLFSATSSATVCSQLNPAAIYSPTSPYIFSAGSSSAQTNVSQVSRLSGSSTNRPSFSNNSHVGPSHLGGLPSPRFQHQLDIYNKNQSLMETSGSGRRLMQRPSSQPTIHNSQIYAQRTMADNIAAATSLITSHPTFQSQVAAVVSSLVSNNSSVGLPQAHNQGVNYSHLPVPIHLLYMPSGLGPWNVSSSPSNSQPGNSLSAAPFPYHVAEAPLFPTSQNGDHSK